MKVEGQLQTLGTVQNFRGVSQLAEALPNAVAISWTHLDPGQSLEPHCHELSSMVIICQGSGTTTGDTHAPVQAGDVVWIPAWNRHGFDGGSEGFWALSIQFQRSAIFEHEDNPHTTYVLPESSLPSLAERALRIIRRADLPELNAVTVEGEKHELGRVLNFRSETFLDGVLPDTLSLAWVQLQSGQILAEHVHETDSMILVTEGEGRVLGDWGGAIRTGDTIFVPAGGVHGFRGEGCKGFWGLSIQFESTSLYDDPGNPRVRFLQGSASAKPAQAAQAAQAAPSPKPASLERLMKINAEHAERFACGPVFDLLRDGLLEEPEVAERFRAALRSWSDHFQRLMYARFAFTRDPQFEAVYLDHLLDELGHNEDLAEEPLWDPVLDALGTWFTAQSLSRDNVEITAMVHLVLERAATIFYPRFIEAFGTPADQLHFAKHLDVDCEHVRIGAELLQRLRAEDYRRLEFVLEQSWGVFDALLARVAELSTQAARPQTEPLRWQPSLREVG